MLHKSPGKMAGQDRQTRWRSRTLPRRLASWQCSSNSKPHQSGPCSIQLFPRAVLIWQACYRSQASRANTHRDLGCIGQEPLLAGAAKPVQGQLASRRDKNDEILLGHCVCRSFKNLHRQTWPSIFPEVLCNMGYRTMMTGMSACTMQIK